MWCEGDDRRDVNSDILKPPTAGGLGQMNLIREGKYEFHSPYWDSVSAEAKDLLSHMLVVDPLTRYTAKQVRLCRVSANCQRAESSDSDVCFVKLWLNSRDL